MRQQQTTTVAICIPTLKRPLELETLLTRLGRLDLDDRIDMQVFVVDNDPARSADQVIERHKLLSELKLTADHEPVPGYVDVRNRLNSLVPADIDWIASIDDDDIPASTDWLVRLVEVAEQCDADMVCGPKLPAPGAGIGESMLERGTVRHHEAVTGAPMRYGWTGNILIRRSILGPDPFDSRFAQTGGEDTELTMRLVRSGHRLVYAPDAAVTALKSSEQLTVDRTAAILRDGSASLAMAYRINYGRLPINRIVRSTLRWTESTIDRNISAALGRSERSTRARLRQAGAEGMLATGLFNRPMARRIALDEAAPLSGDLADSLTADR